MAGGILATVLMLAVGAAGCTTSSGQPPASASAATAGAASPSATPTPTRTIIPTPDVGEPDLAGKFDVGGHSLYLECRGTAGPVLVLETGSGSRGDSWLRSDFVSLLDHGYRRCIYDRANLGRSDKVPGARTSVDAARELHALLEAANLPGPYILVGRSFGGYNVRLFTSMYPDDVSVLVLVETLTPEFHERMQGLLTPAQWAAEASFNRAIEAPLDIIASGPLVADAPLPDLPLLVIAATESHTGDEAWPADWPAAALNALWMEAQEHLAASVPGGKLVVFQGSHHNLFLNEPARLAAEINAFLRVHP